jgi:hypothetical protein
MSGIVSIRQFVDDQPLTELVLVTPKAARDSTITEAVWFLWTLGDHFPKQIRPLSWCQCPRWQGMVGFQKPDEVLQKSTRVSILIEPKNKAIARIDCVLGGGLGWGQKNPQPPNFIFLVGGYGF